MRNHFFTLLLTFIYSLSAKANDNFLNCLNNSNSKSNNEILIFYNPDCQYCLNMESEIVKNKDFQKRITKKFNVKLINVSTVSGKNIASFYNIQSTPTILKYEQKRNKINLQKGFGGISDIEFFLDLKTKSRLKQIQNKLSTCGNGTIEAGEICDDGNTSNADACLNNCQLATCGDGYIRTGVEQCDDANTVGGDGCESNCRLTLGIDEHEIDKSKIEVFPNPAKESININFFLKENTDVEITLIDESGKIVYYNRKNDLISGNNNLKIELDKKIQSGLYFIHILSNDKTKNYVLTKKVFIN